MISVTLRQLANILHGKVFGYNITIDDVAIDTNKITLGCLFIALKGKRFDAHDFANQAKISGAGAMLVNRKLNIDLPQLVVKDTRLALNKLAAWVRQQTSTKIIAITGSSGKTSVKEMTASILKKCGNTLYTLGNLNNDIGVSITLLRLTKKHKYAVIELGGSYHGDIAWITNLVRPDVALVNNFTAAHLESFGSLENIAKAKGEIYTGLLKNGIAILNADINDWLRWQETIGVRKTWYFSSKTTSSDFTATNIHTTINSTEFTINTPIGNIEVFLPLPGCHNISNALAATALSISVGAPLTAIRTGLANLKAIPGRLFPISLMKNKLLIDDSYNANIDSMIVAVQVLSKMPGYRVMVVGDMTELGDKKEIYHTQVGDIAKIFNLDCVLSIGTSSINISIASGIGKHFIDMEILITYLKNLLNQHSIITVLVKGSRSSAMERIVNALQRKKYANVANWIFS